MSAWIPAKGDLFYLRFKSIEHVSEGMFGDVIVTKQCDRSYSTDVFRMVASDSHMVLATKITEARRGAEAYRFAPEAITMHPVSPQVAAALGIQMQVG